MIGNRKLIAVCLARIQDEASNKYITALKKALLPKEYTIFVYHTCSVVSEVEWKKDPQTFVYELMDYDSIDTVIVFEEVINNQRISDELIYRAKQHEVPVIVIGERHEGCVNIRFDHENGIAETVRHLIQEHHLTKLHFMAGVKGNPFSEYRLEAFKRVLQENHLPFMDSMVSYGDFWSDPAERETEKIIASQNIPEAIICANDKMAISVCGILNKHGIKVPEDVVVTGFDGTTEINFSTPRITSSTCDVGDLAKKTATILCDLTHQAKETKTFLVLPRLCVAESCGCHGEKTKSASEYLNVVNDRFYRFQEEELSLSKIAAQIQQCNNMEQVAKEFRKDIIYDMCCVVEKECMDETINPVGPVEKTYTSDREMILLYDSYTGEDFRPYPFSLKEVIPHMEYVQDHSQVLIFTALHHMNVPMGYICFFFVKSDFSNYLKIPQTVNALNNAIGGYRSLRHEHYLMNRIEAMYRTDTLTGLYNRRGFELEYQKLLNSLQDRVPLTIVLADLDRLKYINDTFGHKEGDFAIHAVAQALVKVCPEGALFTRFGGDEMLGVCLGVQEPALLKEKFAQYFKGLNERSGKPYRIEASVGICVTNENEKLDFEQLVEKSDVLMYEEKERRRKKIVAGSGK